MAKNLTSKEIWNMREMLSLTKNKLSRFSTEDDPLTLADVVKNRINFVIEREVLNPPYISAVTVNQMLYDGGTHWKQADDSRLKMGILQHAGVSRPPNWYLAKQGSAFGYIMDWPPVALRSIVTGTIKGDFVNPLLDGVGAPYVIGYCKGYICEDNGEAKYIQEQGRFISTYFIVRKDKLQTNELASTILHQPWWFRKQWLMMLEKLPYMLKGWKRLAENYSLRSEAMRLQWNVDEGFEKSSLIDTLDPQVPLDMIDWRGQSDDDE